MSKKILFVAYHYLPITHSSGVHRTLAFTRYLAEWGHDVSVLTTVCKAYPNYDIEQIKDIPPAVKVVRAWAKDATRDFAYKGKHLQFMSIPDRYQTWIIGGVISGLKAIRANRPEVIISTFPVASAHVIGYILHKITGIPWVTDFRDPMAQDGYPSVPILHKSFRWIENKVFAHASEIIFVTDGAKKVYEERFPDFPRDRIHVIPNGYDEKMFGSIPLKSVEQSDSVKNQKFNLIHSGIIYPSDRDPSHLFIALKQLKDEGKVSEDNFVLTLRGCQNDSLFIPQISALGIGDIVKFASSIPYKEAIVEMANADGLLILQAVSCNNQIPAKAYEYLRLSKPVIALTDPCGETGKLIIKSKAGLVVALDDVKGICRSIEELLAKRAGVNNASLDVIKSYSREASAKMLESLFEKI